MPWRGPDEPGAFPTLGYVVAEWVEEFCAIPDGEFAGEPFLLTDEQLLFYIWFYRLHPDADKRAGRPGTKGYKPSRAFVYDRGAQLVMPQKWGKGPFSASWICAEAQGPVLFDGWDANGEPVGRPWPTPWIQVTAWSEGQTDNIWRALLPMVELGSLRADIPDTGETRINLPGGGKIEPVTSSSGSRLGQRITAAAQDQAESWTRRNGGRKLADTQRRNLAGMGGRWLESANAWDPRDGSVAQETSEEKAPGVYKMMGSAGRGSVHKARDRARMLARLFEHCWWVDRERVDSEIVSLLERGEIAQAERFFLNRPIPGEDAAFDVERWAELTRPGDVVPDGALITIGVDGARYVDALAVVATGVEEAHQFVLGIWERPKDAPEDYEHDLDAVDGVVLDAFERFDVWRVYIDPGSQYANISPLAERWQGRWGAKRIVEWLMSRPKATAFMVRNYASAIGTGDLTHDGNERMAEHVANARRKPVNVYDEDGRQMWVISKEAPGSAKKIDAAAAGALSWEARGDAVAAGAKAEDEGDGPEAVFL